MIHVGYSSAPAFNESYDSLEAVNARLSQLNNSQKAKLEKEMLNLAIKKLGNNISSSRIEAALKQVLSKCTDMAEDKAIEYSKVTSGVRKLTSLAKKYKLGMDTQWFYTYLCQLLDGRPTSSFDKDRAQLILDTLSEDDLQLAYAMAKQIRKSDTDKDKLAEDMLQFYLAEVAPMLAIAGRITYLSGGRFKATDKSETYVGLQKAAGLKGNGISTYGNCE